MYSDMFLVWSLFYYHIIKNIFRWAESPFFLEKITSSAGLLGSELKTNFHWNANFEINERSWVRSLALFFYSWQCQKEVYHLQIVLRWFLNVINIYKKGRGPSQQELVSIRSFVYLRQLFEICEKDNLPLIHKICQKRLIYLKQMITLSGAVVSKDWKISCVIESNWFIHESDVWINLDMLILKKSVHFIRLI